MKLNIEKTEFELRQSGSRDEALSYNVILCPEKNLEE